tara:strand:- start:115 stop:804 length:690 start_codon:yes stop_codon:yes gene_type:complete
MRISLIMNDNSYPGREYLSRLRIEQIIVDVICIGDYSSENEFENLRCDNLWKPIDQNELKKDFNFYYFESLNSIELIDFLIKKEYDIGIQGGTGILKPKVFNKFKYGILNFHPGKLPEFRGCSCPEWQIVQNLSVFSTCHLIDSGIDTGKIIDFKKLNLDYSSYAKFRSSLYPETSKFVCSVIIKSINLNKLFKDPVKQDDSKSKYYKPIDERNMIVLKEKFDNSTLFL